MRREIGGFKERTVGWLIYGGAFVSILSVLLLIMFFMIGTFRGLAGRLPLLNELAKPLYPALAVIGIAFGIVLMFCGLGYGLWSVSNERKGPRQSASQFRVLSRYCIDRTQQLITSELDIEFADRPRFYVRGMLENGLVVEFETTIEVFFQAGEGMYGEAELQGKWLGRFIPYIGVPTASNPYPQ